jgi:hypothetical protein
METLPFLFHLDLSEMQPQYDRILWLAMAYQRLDWAGI